MIPTKLTDQTSRRRSLVFRSSAFHSFAPRFTNNYVSQHNSKDHGSETSSRFYSAWVLSLSPCSRSLVGGDQLSSPRTRLVCPRTSAGSSATLSPHTRTDFFHREVHLGHNSSAWLSPNIHISESTVLQNCGTCRRRGEFVPTCADHPLIITRCVFTLHFIHLRTYLISCSLDADCWFALLALRPSSHYRALTEAYIAVPPGCVFVLVRLPTSPSPFSLYYPFCFSPLDAVHMSLSGYHPFETSARSDISTCSVLSLPYVGSARPSRRLHLL